MIRNAFARESLMTFARCLATLKEHFEIIMQRFDVQDALLNQMITRRVGSKGRKYQKILRQREQIANYVA